MMTRGPEKDYISYIRSLVGTTPVILNFGVVCIVREDRKILLQLRDPEGKQWGFPGGALNYGESYRQAAVREAREETGLDVELGRMIGLYDLSFAVYPNGDRAQTIVAFFLARPTSNNLRTDGRETHGLAWFDPQEAPELFNEQHTQMLQDYLVQALDKQTV